jgi:8-oxo-dGTP pyrophosphatase MutT (NUDIX family)
MVVPARDAATVMLVRDADDDGCPGIEVCMLRRNLASTFVAGAYVFPGGSVDPEDGSPEAMALCDGRDDVEASAILGVASGGLAFWVAALRECFEEAGVLVARRAGGDDEQGALLAHPDAATEARLAAYRLGLNEGRVGIVDICREEGLRLAADTVHYVSHWITPEVAPRRYDTRFFVTAAPPGQDARHDDGETIASEWVRPAAALARYRAGEIEMLPPTVSNFSSLAPFDTSEAVMAWARTVTSVPTVLPIVEFEDGKALIFRPGDDGYEAAADRRTASGEGAVSEVWPPAGESGFGRVVEPDRRRRGT